MIIVAIFQHSDELWAIVIPKAVCARLLMKTL
jgi:hypothetical protein